MDKATSSRISELVEQHKEKVLLPVCIPFAQTLSQKSLRLCPVKLDIIIWDPLRQYPQYFKDGIQCKVCNQSTHFIRWKDGSSKANEPPRKVHCFNGIIIVVTPVYICRERHETISSDPSVLKLLPSLQLVPFVLLHKTGVSLQLYSFIISSIINGQSIADVQLAIESMRKSSLIIEKSRLSSFRNHDEKNCNTSYMHSLPSRYIITQFFTAYYRNHENYFTHVMSQYKATSISVDHTFKVPCNVGLLVLGKWVIQYDSLFIVLNEKGQVVAWQLTRGTSFKQVRTLLENFNKRNNFEPLYIYLDNCCNWRNKVISVFGKKVIAKQDLFHAIQRFTKELPKYHSSSILRSKCKTDYKNVFREDGDFDKERKKATPNKEKMLSKLCKFNKDWQNVKIEGKRFLSVAANTALENIQTHIEKGCLENIPPKSGTIRNESLHRQLNKAIKIPKCSVELLVSSLGCFFNKWNADHSEVTTNDVHPFIEEGYLAPTCEKFGIGVSLENFQESSSGDSALISFVKNTSSVISEVNKILEVSDIYCDEYEIKSLPLKDIGVKEGDILRIIKRSVQHLVFFEYQSKLIPSSNLKRSFTFSTIALPLLFNNTLSKEMNEDILASLGLKRMYPNSNGFCITLAISHYIKTIVNENKNESFKEHFKQFIDVENETVSEINDDIKNIIVNEILQNKNLYIQHFNVTNDSEFTFNVRNLFSTLNLESCISFVVVTAISNALRIPIIFLSNMSQYDYIPVLPVDFNVQLEPIYIYLVYCQNNLFDPVVYDEENREDPAKILEPDAKRLCCGLDIVANNNIESRTKTTLFCRCGRGRNKDDKEKKRCVTNICPCKKESKGCNPLCKCNNCFNDLGVNKIETSSTFKQRRPREKQENQVKRLTTTAYMSQKNELIVRKGWSNLEHFIFDCCCDFLAKSKLEITWNNIDELYAIVKDLTETYPVLQMFLSTKSSSSISQKLNHHLLEANAYRALLSALLHNSCYREK